MNKLIYFHGFGSSGEGSTVKTLQELLRDWIVLAPDIPVDPAEALPFLEELCKKEQPDVIVGTSMGGMYAQQIRGFKRICVNPAFDLPQHKDILYEGTFEFFNPRKNGETTFTITSEIISHFEEMEAHQFDGVTDEDRENVYGLFADGDTTVNCEPIFRQHYQNVIHFHGEHRLNRQVIEEVIVPSFLVVSPNDTVPAIKDKVKETVAQHLKIDKGRISLSSELVRDLGADSLNVIEIVLKLEKEFGIRFIDNELNNLKKVGDFVTVIEKKKKGVK